jgi:hypothetical protein
MRPADEARVPNLVGATGLLRIPSAYVQSEGALSIGFSAMSHETSAGALAGVGNRLELGAFGQGQGSEGTRFVGSAKLNLAPEQLTIPAVSVGLIDPFGSGKTGPSGYIIASKDIIPYFMEATTGAQRVAIKLHVGFGGGLYHRELFAGAEIVGSEGASLIGEIVAGRPSIGARYAQKGFTATVGWIDLKTAGASISYAL